MTQVREPTPIGKLGIWASEHHYRKIAPYLHRAEEIINPNYLTHYHYASLLYLNARKKKPMKPEDLEKAIAKFKLSINENPRYPYSHFGLGAAYKTKAELLMSVLSNPERYRQAIETLTNSRTCFLRAAELQPDLAEDVIEFTEQVDSLERICSINITREN